MHLVLGNRPNDNLVKLSDFAENYLSLSIGSSAPCCQPAEENCFICVVS